MFKIFKHKMTIKDAKEFRSPALMSLDILDLAALRILDKWTVGNMLKHFMDKIS